MALARRIPDLMTVAEFLQWDSPGGYLWQLVDGVPVAMAPPAPLHGTIQNETGRLIGNHLIARSSPCTAITTPGVIPPLQSDRNFLIPDLAVTCSSADMAGKALHDPILIIEILSPSNHAETWRNVSAYMTIPALHEILVIRTASVGVDLLRRGGDGSWPDRPLAITAGTFTLASIDISLPVSALYRGTGMA
jgi:Uma2 family endonuclease